MKRTGFFLLRNYLSLGIIFLLSLTPVFSLDIEHIISFNSNIIVHSDASMTVTETIKVHSELQSIKHGIYREFPTSYQDRLGDWYNLGFRVKEVMKDGSPEPYHIQRQDNGVRVYIGQPNIFLSPIDYTYTIVYETNRQLGFFKDHDELYWNVTGNGWNFDIENASAKVSLPLALLIKYLVWKHIPANKGLKKKIIVALKILPVIYSSQPLNLFLPDKG